VDDRDHIASAACARVFEPLFSERVVHEETINLEPEPGYWESWALCVTEGKVSSPYISGGRILIGIDCDPASYLVGSPSMIAGLVWVTEYGKKKITHVCVEEGLRQHGVGRALVAAYRKWVSKRMYFSGPFSEAGLAFARRMGGEVEPLDGLGDSKESTKLPVTYKRVVWHVGYLKASWAPGRTAGGLQLEGSALAVSEVPWAWRYIAKLGKDPLWECRPRRGFGVFVDYHALSKLQRRALTAEAVRDRWLVPMVVYDVYSTTEEGEEVYSTYATRQQAAQELQEGGRIVTRHGYKGTPKFDAFWQRLTRTPISLTNAEHQAHLIMLEKLGRYDGVWWYERLAPESYSAPRGAIFQSKLSNWLCRESNETSDNWLERWLE